MKKCWWVDTLVLVGGVVFGFFGEKCEGVRLLSGLGVVGGICRKQVMDGPLFSLQQPQFPGPRYGFGAPLDLEFTEDQAVVPFNRIQGEEEPLSDFTI